MNQNLRIDLDASREIAATSKVLHAGYPPNRFAIGPDPKPAIVGDVLISCPGRIHAEA